MGKGGPRMDGVDVFPIEDGDVIPASYVRKP